MKVHVERVLELPKEDERSLRRVRRKLRRNERIIDYLTGAAQAIRALQVGRQRRLLVLTDRRLAVADQKPLRAAVTDVMDILPEGKYRVTTGWELSHVKRAWREEALLIVEGQDGKQIRLHSPGRSSTSEPPRESLSSFFKATVGVNTEETLALYEWWERTETANIERFVESLGIQLEEKESSPS